MSNTQTQSEKEFLEELEKLQLELKKEREVKEKQDAEKEKEVKEKQDAEKEKEVKPVKKFFKDKNRDLF